MKVGAFLTVSGEIWFTACASGHTVCFSEFAELKNKYKNTDSASKFNYDTLDLFLKYDIVDVKSVRKLREKNKLKIDGIDELIKKYEEVK